MTKSEELLQLGKDCSREQQEYYDSIGNPPCRGRAEPPLEIRAIDDKYQLKYKEIIDKYNRTPE